MRKIFLIFNARKKFSKRKIIIDVPFHKSVTTIDKQFEIEPFCCFNKNTKRIWSMGSFSYTQSELPEDTLVGRYCSIADGVKTLGYQHPLNRFTTSNVTYQKVFGLKSPFLEEYDNFQDGIVIKNDVWIGSDVTIKRGVKIGNGAVIGAHSVVTKDVPDFSIVVGVPARVIRYRFDAEIIKQLVDLSWWDYSHSDFHNLKLKLGIIHFIDYMKTALENGRLQRYVPDSVFI